MIYTKVINNAKSDHLVSLVKNSSIATQLLSIAVTSSNSVDFNFAAGLTESEQTTLQSIADTYTAKSYIHPVEQNGYEENIYSSKGKLTNQIIWDSSDKTRKFKETIVTYSGSKVASVTTEQYDGYGVLESTLTETYIYQGNNLKNISRSWS